MSQQTIYENKQSKTHINRLESMLVSCAISIQLFEPIYEGLKGKLYKVRLKQNGKHIALKKVLVDPEFENREGQITEKMKSPFLVKVIDVYYQTLLQKTWLNIMMELYQYDLKQFISFSPCIEPLTLKILAYQMLRSLTYMHSKGICHRDVKPDNFLMKNQKKIVLSDFGSAKRLKTGQTSLNYICSRPYRAPQLLLGSNTYDQSIDIWSLGCVFAEMVIRKPLFSSTSSIDQLIHICRVFGTKQLRNCQKSKHDITIRLPDQKGVGLDQVLGNKMCPVFKNLIKQMISINPTNRLQALEALCHPYFDELRQQHIYNDLMKESGLSSLFYFSKSEIGGLEHLKGKLIPKWLKGHKKTSPVFEPKGY